MIDLCLLTQKNQTLWGVIGRNIALWQNLWVGVGRFERRLSSARASLALCGRFNQFRSPYSWITMRRALRKRRVFDFVPSYLNIFIHIFIKRRCPNEWTLWQKMKAILHSTWDMAERVSRLRVPFCLLFLWIKKVKPLRLRSPPPGRSEIDEERSSIAEAWCSTSVWPNSVLPAQRRTLNHIIMAFTVVFVGEQRRDTYYRNDPSEYDLEVLERQGPSFISYVARVCLWVLYICGVQLVSWWQRWHVLRFFNVVWRVYDVTCAWVQLQLTQCKHCHSILSFFFSS